MFFPAIKKILNDNKRGDYSTLSLGGHRSFNFRTVKAPGSQNTVLRGQGTIDGRSSFSEDRYFTLTFMCNHDGIKDALFLYYLSNLFGLVHIKNHEIFNRLIPDYVDFLKTDTFLNFTNPSDSNFSRNYDKIAYGLESVMNKCDNNMFAMVKKFSVKTVPEQTQLYFVEIDFLIVYDSFDMVLNKNSFFNDYNSNLKKKSREIIALYDRVQKKSTAFSNLEFTAVLKDLFPNAASGSDLEKNVTKVSSKTPTHISISESFVSGVEIVITNNIVEIPLQGYKTTYQHMGRGDIGVTVNLDFSRNMNDDLYKTNSKDNILDIVRKVKTLMRLNQKTYYVSAKHWLFEFFDITNFYLQAEGDSNFESDVTQMSAISLYFLANSFEEDSLRFNATKSKNTMDLIANGDSSNDLNMFLFLHQIFYDFMSKSADTDIKKREYLNQLSSAFKACSSDLNDGMTSIDVISDYVYDLRLKTGASENNFKAIKDRLYELVGLSSTVAIGEFNYMFQIIKTLSLFRRMCAKDPSYSAKVKNVFFDESAWWKDKSLKLREIISMLCAKFLGVLEISGDDAATTTDVSIMKHRLAFVYVSAICENILISFACNENLTVLDAGFSFENTESKFQGLKNNQVLLDDFLNFRNKILKVSNAASIDSLGAPSDTEKKQSSSHYTFFQELLNTGGDVPFSGFKFFFAYSYFKKVIEGYVGQYNGNEIYTQLLSLAQNLRPYYLFFGINNVINVFLNSSFSDKAKTYLKRVKPEYLKAAFAGSSDLDLPSTDFDMMLKIGDSVKAFWGSTSHPSDIILESLGDAAFNVGYDEFIRTINSADMHNIFEGSTMADKIKESEQIRARTGLEAVQTMPSKIEYPSDFSEKMKSMSDILKTSLVSFMPVFYLEFMNVNNVLSSDSGDIFHTLDSVGYSNKIVDVVVNSDSVTKIKTARIVILDVENIVKYTNKGLERVISGETKKKGLNYEYNQKSFPIQQGSRICLSSGSNRSGLKSIFNGYVETVSVDTEKNHLILECCNYAKLMYSGEFNVAFGPGANGILSYVFSVDAWNQTIFNLIQGQLYPDEFFTNLKSLIDQGVSMRKSVTSQIKISDGDLPRNKALKISVDENFLVSADKIKIKYNGKEYTCQLDYLVAPSYGEIFYEESARQLSLLIADNIKNLKIIVRGVNSKGFPLITLHAGKNNVNISMVRGGFAFSATNAKEYNNFEKIASDNGLGLWNKNHYPSGQSVKVPADSIIEFFKVDDKNSTFDYEVFDPNEAFLSKTKVDLEDLKDYNFQSSSYFILANILSQSGDTYLYDMNQSGKTYAYVKPSKRTVKKKFNSFANSERKNTASGSILKNIYNVDFDFMHYGKIKIDQTEQQSKYVSSEVSSGALKLLKAVGAGVIAALVTKGNIYAGVAVGGLSLANSLGDLAEGEYYNTSSYMNCLVDTSNKIVVKDSEDLDGTSFSYTKKKASIAEILDDMQSRYAGAVWDVLEDGKTATLFFGRKNYMLHRKSNPYSSTAVTYNTISKNYSVDLSKKEDLGVFDNLTSFLNNFSAKLVETEKLIEIEEQTKSKTSTFTIEPYANQIVAVSGVNLISAVITTNFDVKNTAIVHYDDSFLGELFTDFFKNISQRMMNPLNDRGKISVPILLNMPYEFYQPFVAPKTTKENVTSEFQAYETAMRILEDELTNFYDGQIIITHNPDVRIGTELTLSDPYNGLFGTVVVKDFSHHISPTLGTITMITPGLKHDYFDSFSSLIDATSIIRASVNILERDEFYDDVKTTLSVSRVIDLLAPSSYPITLSQGFERTQFYKDTNGNPLSYQKNILFPKEKNVGISSTIYPIYSNDKLLTPFPETLLAYCAGMQYTNSVLGNFFNNIGGNFSNFTKKSLTIPARNVFNWTSDVGDAFYDSFTTQTDFTEVLAKLVEKDDGGGGTPSSPQNYFDKNSTNASQLEISPSKINVILDPGPHIGELVFEKNPKVSPSSSAVFYPNTLDSYFFAYLSELGDLFLTNGLLNATKSKNTSGLKGLFENTKIEKTLFILSKDIQKIVREAHGKGYVFSAFLNYLIAVACEKTMVRGLFANYLFLGSGPNQIIKGNNSVDFEIQRLVAANSWISSKSKKAEDTVYITIRSPHKGYSYKSGGKTFSGNHIWFLYDPQSNSGKSNAHNCAVAVNTTMSKFYNNSTSLGNSAPYTDFFDKCPALSSDLLSKYKSVVYCMVNNSNSADGVKLTLSKDFRETLFKTIIDVVSGFSTNTSSDKNSLKAQIENYSIIVSKSSNGNVVASPYFLPSTLDDKSEVYIGARIRALDICSNKYFGSSQNKSKSVLQALLPTGHKFLKTFDPKRKEMVTTSYTEENAKTVISLSNEILAYHKDVILSKNIPGVMVTEADVSNSFRKHQSLYWNMEQCTYFSNHFNMSKYPGLAINAFDSFMSKLTAIGTAAYTSKLSAFNEIFYVFPHGKNDGNEKADFIKFIKTYLYSFIKQRQIVDNKRDNTMIIDNIQVVEVRRYSYKNSLLNETVDSIEFMILVFNVNDDFRRGEITLSTQELKSSRILPSSNGKISYVFDGQGSAKGVLVNFNKSALDRKTLIKTLALPMKVNSSGRGEQAILKESLFSKDTDPKPINSYFFIHAFDTDNSNDSQSSVYEQLINSFKNFSIPSSVSYSGKYLHLLGDFNFNKNSSGNSDTSEASVIEFKIGSVVNIFYEKKGFSALSNAYSYVNTSSEKDAQNDHIFVKKENPLYEKSVFKSCSNAQTDSSRFPINMKVTDSRYYLSKLLGVGRPYYASNHPIIYISY